MQTTYKFRMYPTKQNEEKMLWTLDKCRFVYNKLLEGLSNQEQIDKGKLQHSILEMKKECPELLEVYSKVLQYENYRLFSNLRALSRLKKKGKRVGRLRFKSGKWFKTFNYNQSGFKIIKNNTRFDTLHLSKIGDIPFIMHRDISGDIKQITIKHTLTGKWFASIVCENKEEVPKTSNTKKVGIDVGLDNFAYDSDNNSIKHPKYLYSSSKKLSKEQRRLSRKKKGSKNRMKQKLKVARIHELIVNQRDDFLHKLSKQYADNYGLVVVEDLNITGMLKNHYLAKSITDASWSRFVQLLDYKVERTGGQVIKIDAKNTTQLCSSCGLKVPKKLWNRTHKCSCGLEISRDYNSAINILNKALLLEQQEYTPVEIEPLLLSNQGQVQSMKQEAMTSNEV